MGRVTVDCVLSNYADLMRYEAGEIPHDSIRRMVLQGVVDSKVMRLVLPESVVKFLGLPISEQTTVQYADHRRVSRDVAKNAYVELLGRGGVFKAVVEPNRSQALIGAIVMEDLDLLVDCGKQQVFPRDPNTTISEVE